MRISTDALTTIAGSLVAAGTAAQPVLDAAGGASLHQADYFKLAVAIGAAIWGFFTNKGKQPA